MKMREEIDAMRTLGLDPIQVLVVPRVLALIITLPLLGVIADFAGLIGGADDGLDRARRHRRAMFVVRLRRRRSASGTSLVGMIKAPFFALVIGSSAATTG